MAGNFTMLRGIRKLVIARSAFSDEANLPTSPGWDCFADFTPIEGGLIKSTLVGRSQQRKSDTG